jgi:EF-hand domain
MVVVPMKTYEVQEAIHYSRTAREEGTDPEADEIPRRGFLQVDDDFDQLEHVGGVGISSMNDTIKVALPRNLLVGFCKIRPLMEIGTALKEERLFPGDDDYVPAIDLIVRHACKNQWSKLVEGPNSARKFFQKWDLNGDGVLEFDEIKEMLTFVLGHTPPDFMVHDMIDAIDEDKNGVIDESEISHLIAQIERERFWKS